MSFFENTRKPKGLGGKLMVTMMNSGHTPLANWGFSHVRLEETWDCLDIGCGGGKNIQHMLKICPKGSVKGIDYSEVSVETSRRLNRAEIAKKRCEILKGDVMRLPFEKQSFDLVTAFETVYFWPDPAMAFGQIQKTLKTDGTFLICNEINGENEKGQKWTDIIQGMKIYNEKQLTDYLIDAGFHNIKADKNDKGWICITATVGKNEKEGF